LRYPLITIFVVLLDQLSKIYIKKFYFENDIYASSINIFGNFLRITYIENPGIAFGIDTSKIHFLITFLTLIAIAVLLIYTLKSFKYNRNDILPLSLILGGAIGNAIDRIIVLLPHSNYNGVIDFIDIGFNHYRWYIFNFADMFISIGLFIIILESLKNKKNNIEK